MTLVKGTRKCMHCGIPFETRDYTKHYCDSCSTKIKKFHEEYQRRLEGLSQEEIDKLIEEDFK